MYKCALCQKEVEKIKKMVGGRTGKPPKGFSAGDTLIILDVCEECYKATHPSDEGREA